MFEITAIQRLLRMSFEALFHDDVSDLTLSWMDEKDCKGWELEYRLSFQQAGYYDDARDAVGMHIGEGFIRWDGLSYEIDQVTIKPFHRERLGDSVWGSLHP